MKTDKIQTKSTISNGSEVLRAYHLDGVKSTSEGLREYMTFNFTVNDTEQKQLKNPCPILIESVQANGTGDITITAGGLPIVMTQSSAELICHPQIVLDIEGDLEVVTTGETNVRITARRVALV